MGYSSKAKVSWIIVLSAGALTTCSQIVAAQPENPLKLEMAPMIGTLWVRFEPYQTEGKLTGCTLLFSILAVDNKYNLQEYLKLDGNVGILNFDGNLGSNLKLVVNRMDFGTTPIRFIPSAPTRAYLIRKDFSTSLTKDQKSFPAETPGGIFSTFDVLTGMDFIAEAMEKGTLGIGFNQNGGKSDIVVQLDFNVIDMDTKGNRKRSSEPTVRFGECLSAVANTIAP